MKNQEQNFFCFFPLAVRLLRGEIPLLTAYSVCGPELLLWLKLQQRRAVLGKRGNPACRHGYGRKEICVILSWNLYNREPQFSIGLSLNK